MIFFTADQHFGHANIIKYCNRPYKSVEEMNEDLVYRWNSVVGKADTVYHLGDLAWKNSKEWMEKLNGKIVLIHGNHDESVQKPVFMMEINHIFDGQKQKIVLCHYPIFSWNGKFHGSWHLYGHVHNGEAFREGLSMNVGVDVNDYRPISIYEVEGYMNHIVHGNAGEE